MNWKTLDPESRSALVNATRQQMTERLRLGIKNYGEDYHHEDPIEDISEELVDALIYLEWVRRQRAAVRGLLRRILNESDDRVAVGLASAALGIIAGQGDRDD